MDDALAYAHRPRPIGGEVQFRLDPHHLFVDTGRKEERIPYGSIVAARLTYQPSNAHMRAFRTVLRLQDGRTVRIGSLNWRGPFEAERKDEPYAVFVRALLARVTEANPDVVCRAGRGPVVWALTAILGGALVLGLVAVAVTVASQGSWPILALVGLIGLPLAWQVYEMTWRNRPRPFAPPAIPPGVMP